MNNSSPTESLISTPVLKERTRETVNIILLAWIAVVESFYIVIILAVILNFFPPQSHADLFRCFNIMLYPNRQLLLYQIFIIGGVIIQVTGWFLLKNQLKDKELSESLSRFLIVDFTCLLILFFVIFKMFVYEFPSLTKYLFYLTLGMSCLLKIFWWKINSWIPKIEEWLRSPPSMGILTRFSDVFLPIFIFVIIFIPDRQGVVAQIFSQDRFHHFDTFAMSPAWAFFKNNILYMDTDSQYGFGMPVLISILSRIVGGISYENILLVLIGLAIIYMILCYFFLKRWLKNIVLAVTGVLLILKFQMFNNSSAEPIIWRFPSTSIIRCLLDIPFFILILNHLERFSRKYLFWAGLWSGLAIFYLTDTGMYLTITYYVYLILLLVLSDLRKIYLNKSTWWLNVGYFTLPILTILSLWGIFVGRHIFQSVFWNNLIDMPRMFMTGYGALPISLFAQEKKFLNFFIAVLMLLGYLFTIIFVGTLCYRKKIGYSNLLVLVISIYGLGIFHYYVARSSPNSVPVVCIPFVFVICYWINIMCRYGPVFIRNRILPFLCAISVFSLGTTHAFIKYPNILNLTRASFSEAKQTMIKESIPSKDIDLIVRWTKMQEKVCLISSNETAILMKADRRPFLYYFPFLFPRTFKMLDFGGTTLFTSNRLNKILADFEQEKPKYVFIEHKLLGKLPIIYYYRYSVLTALVKYLQQHYDYMEKGEYLMVLKRKS